VPTSAKIDFFVALFDDRYDFRVSFKAIYVGVSFQRTELLSKPFLLTRREQLFSKN